VLAVLSKKELKAYIERLAVVKLAKSRVCPRTVVLKNFEFDTAARAVLARSRCLHTEAGCACQKPACFRVKTAFRGAVPVGDALGGVGW
jgi:hypothetical protein